MKITMIYGVVAAGMVSLAGCEEREFQPRTLLNPMPAIENAPFVKASKAKSVGDDDLVLALTLDGRSRAYPINMLTGPRREIINDTLGEKAIAATW